jgi:3-deoxy-D-manno-octulosonic-acid transferase
MGTAPDRSILLPLWLGLSRGLAPLARWHLARRVRRGKEDPARVTEKMGVPSCPRPQGRLVWMHAVGVGEVLALPALVNALRERDPEITALITSSSRTSEQALAPNLPEGAIHQFLPLDALPFVRRFLDHWRPDLSVWAERDLWPAMIVETHRRGIPLAIVNGRMTAASCRAKARARGLFRALYGRFAHVGVQDAESAQNFSALGADPARIVITGSLKAAAPPLADQPEARARLSSALQGQHVWIAASTHPDEEPLLARAHRQLLDRDPAACLILAPRDPNRGEKALETLRATGIDAALIAPDNHLEGRRQAHVLAAIGQLGLWYRLSRAAFVGGSWDGTGGHNPNEPARLLCPILHGPNVANFAEDYAAYHEARAARTVRDAGELVAALTDPALSRLADPAARVARRGTGVAEAESERLLALMARRGADDAA